MNRLKTEFFRVQQNKYFCWSLLQEPAVALRSFYQLWSLVPEAGTLYHHLSVLCSQSQWARKMAFAIMPVKLRHCKNIRSFLGCYLWMHLVINFAKFYSKISNGWQEFVRRQGQFCATLSVLGCQQSHIFPWFWGAPIFPHGSPCHIFVSWKSKNSVTWTLFTGWTFFRFQDACRIMIFTFIKYSDILMVLPDCLGK